ncbi:MAG: hypothetical protein ACRCT2_03860, partial [Plesiomonas shigelloides]
MFSVGGRVRGQLRLGSAARRVVQVNQAECELREAKISNGTGEVKVTLWDSFLGQAEEALSYAFKNLSTREREEIADLDVPEEGGGEQNDTSTALFSATVKGIEVRIIRKCSSCCFIQRQFVERSETHRCEGCRLKQGVLSFCGEHSESILRADESG